MQIQLHELPSLLRIFSSCGFFLPALLGPIMTQTILGLLSWLFPGAKAAFAAAFCAAAILTFLSRGTNSTKFQNFSLLKGELTLSQPGEALYLLLAFWAFWVRPVPPMVTWSLIFFGVLVPTLELSSNPFHHVRADRFMPLSWLLLSISLLFLTILPYFGAGSVFITIMLVLCHIARFVYWMLLDNTFSFRSFISFKKLKELNILGLQLAASCAGGASVGQAIFLSCETVSVFYLAFRTFERKAGHQKHDYVNEKQSQNVYRFASIFISGVSALLPQVTWTGVLLRYVSEFVALTTKLKFMALLFSPALKYSIRSIRHDLAKVNLKPPEAQIFLRSTMDTVEWFADLDIETEPEQLGELLEEKSSKQLTNTTNSNMKEEESKKNESYKKSLEMWLD